ncbi:MAG: hypothetical protein IPJ19_15190 [Planctomycetes bacterium]|nr:hypothetical protein [Planctomycetota bacterium]
MHWIETLCLACAGIGGAVLVLLTVLSLFGGDHGEVDHGESGELEHDSALNLLSVRSVAAFLAFFGLGGWGGIQAGWSPFASLLVGVAAGSLMLVAVALLFRLPRKLHAEGNLDPANAVGLVAHVYLRIPGQNSGKGKITLSLQGRSAEFHACTNGGEIPTGADVRVARLISSDTFEVEALS